MWDILHFIAFGEPWNRQCGPIWAFPSATTPTLHRGESKTTNTTNLEQQTYQRCVCLCLRLFWAWSIFTTRIFFPFLFTLLRGRRTSEGKVQKGRSQQTASDTASTRNEQSGVAAPPPAFSHANDMQACHGCYARRAWTAGKGQVTNFSAANTREGGVALQTLGARGVVGCRRFFGQNDRIFEGPRG